MAVRHRSAKEDSIDQYSDTYYNDNTQWRKSENHKKNKPEGAHVFIIE